MTIQLVQYDQACRALAAAHAVDEVKDIRDKAEAIRSYARQANNRALEIEAAEIRFRAERRIGELMEDQRTGIGLAKPGPKKIGSEVGPNPPTLAEAGITKHLADRARKYAALPPERFEGMMAQRRDRITHENARVTVNLMQDDKAERRAQREAELAVRQKALPQRRFGVIVADPEWRFEPWSRITGMDRAAENHYPTSVTSVIAERDVPSISAADCILFLWATVPMLPQALLVMGAWEFDYKSHQVWVKDRIGPGYWFRNQHELLLVGTRGNVPAPAPGQNTSSAVTSPRLGHSEKPEVFLEMIEALYPNMPKIELNRRGPARPGWAAWGNEADEPRRARPVTHAAALTV